MRRDGARGRLAVGARIRALRTRHGLTLKEVETRSGFSATHVSEIERGRTSPTIPVLVGIADALGVDPNVLLSDAERPTLTSRTRALSGSDQPGSETTTLTDGIAGGRLRPALVTIDAREGVELRLDLGEVSGIVQEGEVTLKAGGESVAVAAGDGFQLAGEPALLIRNEGSTRARIVVVAKPSSLTGR